MIELFHGCLAFWCTYFCVAPLFPSSMQKIRGIEPPTDIFSTLVLNTIASFLFLPFVSFIPVVWDCHFLLKIPLAIILAECWFYYIHRLFHTKRLYPFHKKHHYFIQPYGLVALYCSVPEMLLANQLTVALPMRLLNYSPEWILFFSVVAALNVVKGHASLQQIFPSFLRKHPLFDGLVSSEIHDIHHTVMRYNFGLFEFLDKFHGTFRDGRRRYTVKTI